MLLTSNERLRRLLDIIPLVVNPVGAVQRVIAQRGEACTRQSLGHHGLDHVEHLRKADVPSAGERGIHAGSKCWQEAENLLEKGDLDAANEFRLHDPNDASQYISAQLFKDNTICICEPGAFRFFENYGFCAHFC